MNQPDFRRGQPATGQLPAAWRLPTAWRLAALALAPLLATSLSGCVGTVTKMVTAPVHLAGRAVDLATTSRSEADEKRGREMRERDERIGALERSYRRHARDCTRGDDEACYKADRDADRIENEMPALARFTQQRGEAGR